MVEQLRVTVGPAQGDTGGFAEIKGDVQENPRFGEPMSAEVAEDFFIVESKSVGLTTVDGGHATLRRDLLRVVGLEKGPEDPATTVLVSDSSGKKIRLKTDTGGALRDYQHVEVAA